MPKSRFLLVLLAILATVPAWADTVYLKDGQVLKGKVVELPDGRIQIGGKNGDRIVDKADVVRSVPDGNGAPKPTLVDVLYLVDGRILRGNVTFSDDGKEVVLTNDKGAESRFPRDQVKSVGWRTGKTPPPAAIQETTAPVTTEEETENRWREQIDLNLKKLRDPYSDDKDRKKARSEIIQLGVFAVPYVKEEIARIGSGDAVILSVLHEVLKVAEIKAATPAKVEEARPGICERLADKDPEARIKAVNEMAISCPDDCASVLLYLIETDPVPKVKSICVGQLSMLRRYDELSQVLKMHEHGQWRLVAALELGEAGIYVGVPVLIEALKLDGPKFQDVRNLAIEKLKAWTHQGNLGYLPDAEDKADRDAAVGRWEAWWQSQGQIWAEKNAKYENGQVSDEDKQKALDRWKDGNKLLVDLQNKQDDAAKTGTKLDPRDVSYAYETAAFLYKQSYDFDPTLCSARLSRAIILYEQLGRPREAEGELKLIITRFAPEGAKYLRALATAHLARICELEASWKRAESYWLEVHVLDPQSIDAHVGIGDSHLERALARSADAAPVSTVTEADSTAEGSKKVKEDDLRLAVVAYKDALKLVDDKQRALRETVTDLGPQTGEIEDHSTGRFLLRVREDRETLIKRAAEVWFRLGRAESAEADSKGAFLAFKAARDLDPKDERYVKAAALWEKIAGGEKP